MRTGLICAAMIVGVIAGKPALAQTPGVVNIAPGVREIHGDQVPSQGIDRAALEAAFKDKKSYSDVRDLLGGDGIPAVGPGGSTVHIYKAHDTTTAAKLVVIVFVKDGEVVDHLIQDVTPRPATANPPPTPQ